MAAFFNIFQPSIVKNIYERALVEPTLAHVLFQNHPLLPQEDFFIILPNKQATIGELQEEMSQMERFKKTNRTHTKCISLQRLMEPMKI